LSATGLDHGFTERTKERVMRWFAFSVLVILGSAPALRAADIPPLDRDEQFLKKNSVGPDAAGLLRFLRGKAPRDVDPRRIEPLVRQLGSSNFAERKRAQQGFKAIGFPALPALREAQTSRDPEIARTAKLCIATIAAENWRLPIAAVRVLMRKRPPGTLEALLQYLPFAVDEATAEEIWFGLDALAVSGGKIHPALLAALTDELPVRRAVSACIVGHRGNADQRAAVRKLLSDADAQVRLRAAQGLLAAKDKAGLPVLVELLNELPVELAWQAEELLHWAANAKGPEPVIGAGKPEARRKCREAWKAWLRQHGPQLDLQKPADKGRRPCLVVGVGTVPPRRDWVRLDLSRVAFVYGCDGKRRWQSRPAEQLGDAQFLGGGRVLCMRSPDNFSVAEYDLEGKLLWKYKWGKFCPHFCRRYPNGNTFIGGFLIQFVEVTREGKEVYFQDFAPNGHAPAGMFPLQLNNGNLMWSSSFIQMERGPHTTLAELDPNTGRALNKTPLPRDFTTTHHTVEELPNGHFLVAGEHIWGQFGAKTDGGVEEFDASGKSVWKHVLRGTSRAKLLRNGNILLSQVGLIEINRAGEKLWHLNIADPLQTAGTNRICFGLVGLGFDTIRRATSEPGKGRLPK
jgi:hypothetical protein